jgi:tetratricopeptide (TPR) repeat protein
MIRRLVSLAGAAALLLPAAARAEWHEVSSNHFVIYGDDSEKSLRRFSEQLEQYQAAMALVTRTQSLPPSPSNRVTIYLVGTEDKVQELAGGDRKKTKNLAGFYVPRAGASIAIAQRVRGSVSFGGELDFSMTVLLHEYAHHFMISNSSFTMPRWYGEGGAEFFSSVTFAKDNTVNIGRPATHRAGELFYAKDVTAEMLLDADAYEKSRGKSGVGNDAYYGKAWLLYHYLTFEPSRKGQMSAYLTAMTKGKSSREAALSTFGDFKPLDRELDSYLNRSRMTSLILKGAALAPGPITVRKLGEGEAAVMPLVIRSQRGVDADQAAQVVSEARALAARYPKDAAVLTALAEAEHDTRNEDAAIAAADAALALDPGRVNAHVQKGYALFRKAEDSRADADFRAARAAWVKLNALENDHPLPLIYYYRSFQAQGRVPSPVAVKGLERAAEVAPYDLGLRMNLAMQLLRDGRRDEARGHLKAVAYNVHGGSLADRAREVLARVDADPAWRGQSMGISDGLGIDAD